MMMTMKSDKMKDIENTAEHYTLLALIMLVFAIVSLNNIRPLQIWADYAFTIVAIIGFLIAIYKRYTLR